MPETVTFTDGAGREWIVREVVSYDERTPFPGELPKVVRTAVIFERGPERRVADDAPLNWRDHREVLPSLFVRARVPAPRSS